MSGVNQVTSQALVVKRLERSDALAYRALRLKALTIDDDCFLSSFESEKSRSESDFAYELMASCSPPIFGYYGVFLADQLIGYAQIDTAHLAKKAHIALIFNVFVEPSHRGQHIAENLLNYLISQLKTHTQVEQIRLSLRGSNRRAMSLYKKLGFKIWSINKKSVKWQEKYDDEIEMCLEIKRD
ncbi:MAG: GNAT family N-acetyltransferase [Patescibacteria group bacterium]